MSVRHALLALLYRRPMHGYELGRQLGATFNGEWEVKPGQVASTLVRLGEAGLADFELAEADGAPERKVYRLTAQGLAELKAWFLAPEVREYRLGDAFYLKLVLSLTGGPVPPEQVLMAQRRELYQVLHQVTELRERADAASELPWVLLLESAIMHLEADLRWIEMCEARLPELKRYRPPAPKPRRRGRPKRTM